MPRTSTIIAPKGRLSTNLAIVVSFHPERSRSVGDASALTAAAKPH
jgi:hypothetical protein